MPTFGSRFRASFTGNLGRFGTLGVKRKLDFVVWIWSVFVAVFWLFHTCVVPFNGSLVVGGSTPPVYRDIQGVPFLEGLITVIKEINFNLGK